MHKVTLIPGDGIGPELAEAMRRCVDATGAAIEWERCEAGGDVIEKYGSPLPESTLESVKRNRVAIKGPITTPIGTGFRSINVELRKRLDLFACVRPCRWYRGVRAPMENVNLVIIRENTEDLYAGIEFEQGGSRTRDLIAAIEQLSGQRVRPDSGISIKPISISGTERIVRFAFEYARANGRRKVTAVTKANIMKFTDGLFQHTAERIAGEYSDIAFEHVLVDNLCMQLVQRPQAFDVLVLPNLYGDIVSDLCAGLVGGLGVAPGANIGEQYAVFEPTHGSAPKYKGLDKVNPTALILSAVMMLKHLGESAAAERLEKAVAAVVAEGRAVTYDMKADRGDPTAVGTAAMADAIIAAMTPH